LTRIWDRKIQPITSREKEQLVKGRNRSGEAKSSTGLCRESAKTKVI
jgi:hypothetical protein